MTRPYDAFAEAARDLSSQAFRLHVEALCWSSRMLLDLDVDKRDLPRFAFVEDVQGAVTELLATSWWYDRGDSYFIGLRFAHWQQDSIQIERKREREAEAQRRRRRHLLADHSLCLPQNCTEVRTSGASPDESRNDARSESVRDPGRVGSGRVATDQTRRIRKGVGAEPDSRSERVRVVDEAMDRLNQVGPVAS